MTFPCPSSSSSRSPCPGNGISSLLSALLCCRPANHINALLPLSHCACLSVCVCWCVRARPKVWLPQKNKGKWKEKNEEELAPRFAWFAFAVASLCLAVVRLSPAVACRLCHHFRCCTLSFMGHSLSLLPALSFCLTLSFAVAVAAFWVMSISRAAGNIICPGSPAGIHFNSVQRLLLLLLLPSTHPHP